MDLKNHHQSCQQAFRKAREMQASHVRIGRVLFEMNNGQPGTKREFFSNNLAKAYVRSNIQVGKVVSV